MHRKFKQLLPDAVGVSEFVIALNVDIRGFSEFSMKVESPETAVYIKRAYAEMLDGYFQEAAFFKPTGDGLLVITTYTEATLADVAAATLDSCLRLVTNFPTLTAGDAMVNFAVPSKLGIGIAR